MSNNWNSLDNAAIIFPAAAGGADTQVFRISCELHDKIDPDILQNALDETITIFRFYQSVLKRGLFWYYLEESKLTPVVHIENTQPCGNIYSPHHKKLLFDVSYFNNRVNLEIYHVLSDGTGALNFLKTLITKYLSKRHQLPEPPLPFDVSALQMSDDSFKKYYTGTRDVKRKLPKIACQLRGPKYPEDRLKVITGTVGIGPLIDAAHKYNTKLTVFLCACLIEAISESVSAEQKANPIVLAVPVDLRQHFPSASVRNFFSILLVGYDYANQSGTFEDIIQKISGDLATGTSQESLAKWIDSNSAIEHLVVTRLTPLIIKDRFLKIAYNYTMRRDTAGFSNLGIISMPPELSPHIRSFDFFSGTDKLQVCICSFQDRLSISFSSPFISTEIPKRFFRTLTDLNAVVEINTNNAGDGKGEI
ncbi:MAG: hypothetical protein WCP73_03945 [Eubacteriales bacterium]